MKVGVIDIGTNSMRLLITDGAGRERHEEVTGLGRGVDSTGLLSEAAMQASLEALERFHRVMQERGVARRDAIATSASRDATNREEFFDRVESVLEVRPRLISGGEEARLAYLGATGGSGHDDPVVCDIGGGSTELVERDGGVSIDIGSVRLTERHLDGSPPSPTSIAVARSTVRQLLSGVEVGGRHLIGVAGTWTSIGAMVGAGTVSEGQIADLVSTLCRLDVHSIASLPGLDPRRAPVILGGALVAETVMGSLGFDEAVISAADTLDAVAAELMGLL